MKLDYLFLLLCCLYSSSADDSANEDIAQSFVNSGIIHDVIDTPPTSLAKVEFDSGVEANLGNTLTPTMVKNQPNVTWDAEDDQLYTLIMTDPDAPSHREWHHWLVVNIPGNDISQGDTLTEFMSSAPPKNSGLHRYVILVFKQQQPEGERLVDEQHGFISSHSGKGRANFSTKKFAADHKLGQPIIAGNFFRARYDNYVPTVHASLTDL